MEFKIKSMWCVCVWRPLVVSQETSRDSSIDFKCNVQTHFVMSDHGPQNHKGHFLEIEIYTPSES